MATSIPVVPEDTQLVYLAEGAANVVYRIFPSYTSRTVTPQPAFIEEYSDTTPPPSIIETDDEDDEENTDLDIFDKKLLRLRKDLPTTLTVVIAQGQWEEWVKPLFKGDQIVHQQLVKIRPGKIIENLNEELHLREVEHVTIGRNPDLRPVKRQGVYLANDEHGLLITDMTPGLGDAEVIEFKPKWLTQSPSAPKGAKRCRQCAITARRNQEFAKKNLPGEILKEFCPLDLVSGCPKDIVYAAKILLAPEPCLPSVDRFVDWIINSDLLVHLRDAQASLDKVGPLTADPNDWKYRVAMTLRDCTVFVRFPENKDDDKKKIEARIGDLDVKSTEKAEYWKRTEEELIREGWYMGTEQVTTAEPRGIVCRLGRTFNTVREI
ncbi:hypothetical protein EG329_011118 [Mollisiaceae sp. DMI_Dod_QoI]|nr:hypothetical protein EG329_011118 [Helotiales sp. DMI_Dod_QoI]